MNLDKLLSYDDLPRTSVIVPEWNYAKVDILMLDGKGRQEWENETEALPDDPMRQAVRTIIRCCEFEGQRFTDDDEPRLLAKSSKPLARLAGAAIDWNKLDLSDIPAFAKNFASSPPSDSGSSSPSSGAAPSEKPSSAAIPASTPPG